ncbi:AcrB/AcrD/AcrF family protein [Staphylococcus hyicus]|uniref:Efflux RND transporter permease subunit n=2 Tax=Staphylococcus hyicus TaxID=1284 RepID=A0ACD5FPZ4_STAHY|nr:efflux RND transporter permease subunit [Staphylococcus hyicus]AJC95424.1 RND efflux transporter [Staphylococcus hyicus]MCQ9291430.1 efflux RND transporter permease subunit [Staphylococcus hyicus]MCQ9300327.1 efflux RND transporter permease subunit [Staphylococcus hyicus]MCQ9306671.1 efflux RND transporter permease subunit [Staphylococcus hyicus]MCQ9309084.1 efflux RND transporter permease subunit [Staphylococcus hyicus]
MVKKLIDFSLSNRFAIMLMVLLVILGGVYASFKMKLELLPDTEPPMMTITTTMPGATPDTIMKEVSNPIDEEIRGMADVTSVKTESLANASLVTVKFDDQTDLDKVEQELQKTLQKMSFAEGVQDPEIKRNSIYAFPVVAYSFINQKNDIKATTKAVEEQLIPKLQEIKGVQRATVNGQTTRQATLKYDDQKLQAVGLNQQQVSDYIKGASKETPLGLFQFGNEDKSVVIDGQFTSIDALENLEVPLAISRQPATSAQNDSKNQDQSQGMSMSSSALTASQALTSNSNNETVPLKSLARITLQDERKSISKTNGEDAVDVQIVKAQDANTVAVANEVDQTIHDFVKSHDNLKTVKIMDTAKPIKDALSTMIEKALLGAIVAIIVILLFLRNIKMTAISVVSIPLSILIAMVALKLTDVSLNILTLGALTVAVGRVIDDAIVVIENIYRRLAKKDEVLSGDHLIIQATKEVFIPIMSSTIVTIIVFLPLAFVTGSVGEMFRPFAYAVTFSLLASLLVSITIVPVLGSMFFKNGLKRQPKHHLGKLGHGYRKILSWSLDHKWIVIILSTVLLIGSIVLGSIKIGTSFISTGEDKFMALTYKPKPGETKERVLKNAEEVQKYLNNQSHVQHVQYSVGGPSPADPTGSTNSTALMVKYDSDTPNFDTEPERVLKHIATYHHSGDWQNLDMSTGTGSHQLKVQVTGPSTDAIKGTVKEVEHLMGETKGLTNVKSDLTDTYAQYEVKVDHQRASENGITAGQLALLLNQNIPEMTISKIKADQQSYDVVVKQNKETQWTKNKLENTSIPSPQNPNLKLSDIAELKQTTTPNTLVKESGHYTSTITGNISGKDVGGITQDVSHQLSKIKTPQDVKTSVGGTNDDITEAFSQLLLAMLAAIIIVYLVLVLTFKGGLAPFTILFSLPYTIIGVVCALVATGETLSVPSMIGLLMLIGIVVTNAIVLIDRVINNEKTGMSMKAALIEAGGTRIRPILMTAIATIGALFPLLFGQNSSVLISKGLAATVIGGLLSSTLLTLIVVPVIYEILFTLKSKLMRHKNSN